MTRRIAEWPVTVVASCAGCYGWNVVKIASVGTVRGACTCGMPWFITLAEDGRVTAAGLTLKSTMTPVTA